MSKMIAIRTTHTSLFNELAAGRDVNINIVNQLIKLSITSSKDIPYIEDREELGNILRFWGGYLSSKGFNFPDIDISKTERRPENFLIKPQKKITLDDNFKKFLPEFPPIINPTQLGMLEGWIKGLKYVIVMAHKIEEPTDSLQKAVKSNFANRVKYSFMISGSNWKNERHRYYRIFETYAIIAIDDNKGINIPLKELIEIKPLKFEWIDYPYIFYRFQKSSKSRLYTIGLRGTEIKEGIANHYVFLDPLLAHTIAQAVLSPTKLPEKERKFTIEDFTKSRNVIQIDKYLQERKLTVNGK